MISGVLPVLRAFFLMGLAALFATSAVAETKVGSSVESRVTMAFTVDAGDLQPWLPEGWVAVPIPKGPFAGANLIMVMTDQHAQFDSEGKLKQPSAKRFAVFAGLGKDVDGDAVRFYAYRVYSTDMSEDPYGNAEAAAITRSATLSIDAEGARQRSEEWRVAPAAGGTLNLSLDFAGGPQNWASSEARVFSNTIDGFNRTYRYRQLAGLVLSASVGKPLVGDVNYTSDIPELAAIFDGSETLVAILDIPVYARDIFLP